LYHWQSQGRNVSSSNIAATALAAGEFVSLTRAPVTSFITNEVPAPTQLYVRDDAFIQLVVRNINNAGVSVTVRTRLLRADDGQIIESEDTFVILDSSALPITKIVDLTEGFLLSAAVVMNSNGIKRGMCFVSLLLCRKLVSNPTIEQVLAQDYVASGSHLTWPNGLVRQSVEGPGSIIIAAPVNPGSGAEISIATGNLRRQRVIKLSCTLTTSAAVANRLPAASFSDGLGTFFDFYPLSATIPASTVAQIVWAAAVGQAYSPIATQFVGVLPETTYMSMGATFGTKTSNLQAGDAYSNIQFATEEWIEP